ncbi:MAG: EamA family transporter [Eubacteriales bacterium]|nr:EamA family transporter [Eubacteriales bacterium]
MNTHAKLRKFDINRLPGPALIVAAALLWSMAGLFIKYIPWHPMAIASGRSAFAAAIFLLAYRSRLFRRPSKTTWLSGLALMLTQTGFVIANKMTTAANAIMLQYISPFVIVILGVLLYHYMPTRRELVALFVATAGITLFFIDDLSAGNLIGNLIALGTGVTFAVVFLLNNRPECDTPVALFIGQVSTFLVGLPFLLTTQTYHVRPVLALATLGIFQLGLAYLLFGLGIQKTKPLSANLLAMAEPIANPIWVFWVMGEMPGTTAMVGAVIILAAVIYLNAGQLKTQR